MESIYNQQFANSLLKIESPCWSYHWCSFSLPAIAQRFSSRIGPVFCSILLVRKQIYLESIDILSCEFLKKRKKNNILLKKRFSKIVIQVLPISCSCRKQWLWDRIWWAWSALALKYYSCSCFSIDYIARKTHHRCNSWSAEPPFRSENIICTGHAERNPTVVWCEIISVMAFACAICCWWWFLKRAKWNE